MPLWADVLVSLVLGVVVLWGAAIVLLWRRANGIAAIAEAARLLPDLVRVISRLARDRDLPRHVRARLWFAVIYLASPIDLIPDFIPVIGYADDAIVVALTLRSVVRAAGVEKLNAHWPGSPEGLRVLHLLAGLD